MFEPKEDAAIIYTRGERAGLQTKRLYDKNIFLSNFGSGQGIHSLKKDMTHFFIPVSSLIKLQ